MAENEVKIIKYTINSWLAGRDHNQYEFLNKLLLRDIERHMCVEWIDKFNQNNLQNNVRFAGFLM